MHVGVQSQVQHRHTKWNEEMVYLIPKLESVVDDIKKWRHILFKILYIKFMLNY